MGLPKLDEFLVTDWPTNSYIDYPGFAKRGKTDCNCGLYLRKGDIYVTFAGIIAKCTTVIQIGSVSAAKPGKGSFTTLVRDLAKRGFAIYVENVHNAQFAEGLPRLGFIRVNQDHGPNWLGYFEGHLSKVRVLSEPKLVFAGNEL